jgi:metal-responsive CopG/Arc/MetJ family transcriptional regulator
VETIQIVIEKELLRATDRAARQRKVNRSVLVREALRAYLRRLAVGERERRDRAGYAANADSEFAAWNQVTAWPEE